MGSCDIHVLQLYVYVIDAHESCTLSCAQVTLLLRIQSDHSSGSEELQAEVLDYNQRMSGEWRPVRYCVWEGVWCGAGTFTNRYGLLVKHLFYRVYTHGVSLVLD